MTMFKNSKSIHIIFLFLAIAIVLLSFFCMSCLGVGSDAVFGLIGVIIGAIIAAVVQILTVWTEREDRYRLAAIDKRLQAHQEAFALWRKLLSHVYNDNIGSTALECQNWWDNNCLYLDEKARKAFRSAYMSATDHHDFVKNHAEAKLIKDNWNVIIAAGTALTEAVALPPVGELVEELGNEAKGA